MSVDYQGRYSIFDPGKISNYPVSQRRNKVELQHLTDPAKLRASNFNLTAECSQQIAHIGQAIVAARRADKPVVVFTGAHLIKNGLGPLLIDLVDRDLITLVAGNGATAIHDFELALIGATSEDVPNALGQGQFGMAYEFAYINQAIALGHRMKLGLGESLGRMICDPDFRRDVLSRLAPADGPADFSFAQTSLLAKCYQKSIPFTVHVGIGTDVIDQHPSFDPAAKGGCSGRDFLIFTDQIARFTDGGVYLNIGSAVTGPEVLLKAISMAANVGRVPKGLITADFDIRPFDPAVMSDESSPGYYNRDQKSIVTRIPQAFAGHGHYIQGNQLQTLPALYCTILDHLT
jgi:hypothetical protein